jgi:hypothetical protein
MGHPVDRPISKWEEMFLPVKISQTIRNVTVNGAPLVKWEKQIYRSKTHDEYDAPPSRFWIFITVGVLVGGALGLSARLLAPSPGTPREGRGEGSRSNSKVARKNKQNPHSSPLPEYRAGGWARRVLKWSICLVAFAWVTLAGLGGAISTFGWWFTDHYAAKYNENLLQLNPITLPLILLVPVAMFSKRRGRTVGFYLAVVGLALSLLGFALQVLPKWNQPNAEVIALALPAHAGLAWLMYRLFKSQPAPIKKEVVKTK